MVPIQYPIATGPGFNALIDVLSVSYTHLDVYKRQPVIIAMFYVIGLSNIRGIVINRIVVVIESQNKAIVCSITRTDEDVYKRQGGMR